MSRTTHKKKQSKRSSKTRANVKNRARKVLTVALVRSDLIELQSPDDLELHQVTAALQWDGLETHEKEVLAMGGIVSVQDFVQVRSQLQPKAPLRFFLNWIAAYGIGAVNETDNLSRLLAEEYLALAKDRALSRVFGSDGRAEDLASAYPGIAIKPECFYIDLPSSRRYFHTEFERDTPERRLWIEGIASQLGVTMNLGSLV